MNHCEYVRKYKIGNAKKRPNVGDYIFVPFKDKARRAFVIDLTQDEVLVEIIRKRDEQ